MDHYSVNVVWSDEDNCFISTIPEFEGLSAHGETREEAIQEAQIALEGFIEVIEEDGDEVPEPQTLNSFSGQTRIRLPKGLHRDLSHQAKIENVSLNTYIVNLLAERNLAKKVSRDLEIIKCNQEYALQAVVLTKESVPATEARYVENPYEWLEH